MRNARLKDQHYTARMDSPSRDFDDQRFIKLYLKTSRTRQEELELSALYTQAYDKAHQVVSHYARFIGFYDPDILADCATTLIDHAAKRFSAEKYPTATLFGFFYGVAQKFLRKHRDFLTFSRRVTDCGYATADILTRAVFGSPADEGHPEWAVAHEDDEQTVELYDRLDADQVEPLWAAEYVSAYGMDPCLALEIGDRPDRLAAGLQAVEEAEEENQRSVSHWVDFAIARIETSNASLTEILARAPTIVQQLATTTGARTTDIAKRLVTRVKAGCQIALTLLQALRQSLHPERNARAIALIDAALAAQEARETPALADNADTASASLEDPDYIESATPAPTPGARTLSEYSSAPTNLEQTVPSLATETEDLGWLIDTEDLRHGRVPHPKPRYVSVDHNPVDPPGAPPLLEEPTPTPVAPSDASSLLSITASPVRVRPLLLERWPLPPGVVPPVAEPLVSLLPELDECGPHEGVRHRPLWLLPRSRLGIPFPTRLKVPITTIAPYPDGWADPSLLRRVPSVTGYPARV